MRPVTSVIFAIRSRWRVVTMFSSTLTLLGVVVILLLLDVKLALVTFITFPLLMVASLVFRIVSAVDPMEGHVEIQIEGIEMPREMVI